MSGPVLNDLDRQSATWKKLEAHLRDQLESLRKRNDKDLDERKTARLRGEIENMKYVLSLGTEKPLPPPDEDDKFKY